MCIPGITTERFLAGRCGKDLRLESKPQISLQGPMVQFRTGPDSYTSFFKKNLACFQTSVWLSNSFSTQYHQRHSPTPPNQNSDQTSPRLHLPCPSHTPQEGYSSQHTPRHAETYCRPCTELVQVPSSGPGSRAGSTLGLAALWRKDAEEKWSHTSDQRRQPDSRSVRRAAEFLTPGKTQSRQLSGVPGPLQKERGICKSKPSKQLGAMATFGANLSSKLTMKVDFRARMDKLCPSRCS